MRKWRNIALLIETSNADGRDVLHRVVRYIREDEPCSFYIPERRRGGVPPPCLANWQDGITAWIENQRIARSVANSGQIMLKLPPSARPSPSIAHGWSKAAANGRGFWTP